MAESTRGSDAGFRTAQRDGTYPPAPEPLASAALDSHCHLDIGTHEVGMSVDEALAAARAVGVTRLVQIGCDLPSARWSVEVATTHPDIVAGVSLHPNEPPRLLAAGGQPSLDAAYEEIDALASHPRVRAIGETGMDFFHTDESGRAAQEQSFRQHIEMAKRHGKTLVIHDRDSHDAVLGILEDAGPPERVVFHCFSGDEAMARHCVERGWVLSFAGPVTFKNAEPLRSALRVTPLDQLLVETDAPFLTPSPYRGRPNASYLIPYTLRAMAAVKDVPENEIARAVWATGERMFGPF